VATSLRIPAVVSAAARRHDGETGGDGLRRGGQGAPPGGAAPGGKSARSARRVAEEW
jgi:hypothetical protein